jgi:predicted phosphate transport protein (TIGR00153 family)
LFRFRPVDGAFYDLFSEAAQQLVVGAGLLAEMFDATSDAEAVAERMREAEHRVDDMVRAIITRVNSTFVTPFDREDIHTLASQIDDVMDLLDEAVDMLLLYDIAAMPAEVSEQAQVIQICAELTAEAMPRLRTPQQLGDYVSEINRLERSGDRAHRRIIAELFGGGYKALQVLKVKDVVECLERAIDSFEAVATTVEQIAVKES